VVGLGREGGEDVQKVGEPEPAGVGRESAVRRRPVPPQVTLASRAHLCPRRPGNSSSLSVTRLLLLLVVIFRMLMVLCAHVCRVSSFSSPTSTAAQVTVKDSRLDSLTQFF